MRSPSSTANTTSACSKRRAPETAAIRFFNVFGPRQDPKGAYAAAVPIFIEKALRGEDITIFGDGGQTRDFIYVKDIVGALDLRGGNAGRHRGLQRGLRRPDHHQPGDGDRSTAI
jgi:nucleoside-diphosphate-sugar epimerase